ncbi:MAG: GAF domain-containing protein [Anaerolineales bacterium]|jgi:GAF domain-containing protein
MVDAQLLRNLKAENADLKADLSDFRDQNQRLWQVIQALNELDFDLEDYSGPSDLTGMVMNILKTALKAVGSENGSILLLDDDTEELVFVAVVGERQKELADFRIPADSGVAGWVRVNKKPTLVQDVRKDNRWISAVDQSIGFHTQSLMAVPLVMGERVLGVMEVVNALSEDHFTNKDLTLLQLTARLASFIFGFAEVALDSQSES